MVYIWLMWDKMPCMLWCLRVAIKKVENNDEEEVVKKMSLPVSAKRQCVISDNNTHVQMSAPHTKYK